LPSAISHLQSAGAPPLLLTHFARISNAPDAIPRLRQFILELAVRGKLLPQNSNDEPVSELLKRIQAERERRIKAGTMKDQDPLPPVRREEAWFHAPPNWEWVRLGTVSYVVMGQSPPGETYNKDKEGMPLINGPVEFAEGPFGRTVVNQYTTSPTNVCEEGDLLLCVRGSTTGRTNVAAFRACIGRGVAAIRPLYADSYVRLFVWRLRESIIAMGRGIAFPSVSRKQIEELPIPLPPLAEQHRIVAKVDELMALCDRLEASQAERETRRTRLVAAAHARLSDSALRTPDSAFFINTLHHLTARPDDIPQLLQTILDLAVRGKLVPQDPSEEPASELLSRMHSTREHQRQRAALVLSELESPLPDIPPNWIWTVVDQIAADDDNAITDGPFGANLKTEHYVSSPGYRVIRLQNIGRGIFRSEHRSYIDASRYIRLAKHHVLPGDLVVAGLVDPLIRCCQLPSDLGPALVKADCYRLAVHPKLSARFAAYFLNSPTAQTLGAVHHHGMTLTRIGLSNFRRIPFPLPPAPEQHRIVAKVDELMALCDRLEAQLTTTQTHSLRLLETTLHQALNGRL
jgi:type I restriction enzyme, S subunit